MGLPRRNDDNPHIIKTFQIFLEQTVMHAAMHGRSNQNSVPSLSQRPRAEARVEVTTESPSPIAVLLITL